VYPGSFDPLTVAHLAVADAARAQCRLDHLDFAISRVALAKEHGHRSTLEERVEALRAAARRRRWIGVVVTDHQLVADIAAGYDVVVMGADKWAQLHDVAFYDGSSSARDDALARLPEVAIAPRPPTPIPTEGAVILSIPDHLAPVSSTAVHEGRREWDGRRED
jgi:nicotinic acid mononucleotide adenylyltransferase